MSARILTGDVFDMLPTIAPGSVDCCVYSPPYWMLRSYLPKDHPLKPKELGSEPTPGEYIANQVKVARLVRNALADHGTCWINVGDSYSGSTMTGGTERRHPNMGPKSQPIGDAGRRDTGLDSGNLCLIPQRLAIALQDDGWIVRSIVIWHKPACMPASLAGWRWMRCRVKVKSGGRGGNGNKRMLEMGNRASVGSIIADGALAEWSDCPGCAKCRPNGGLVLRRGSWRPTSSYEPILMLAKKPGYFSDGESVKQPAKTAGQRREFGRKDADTHGLEELTGNMRPGVEYTIQAGANLRDVWTIPAEPLKAKHYAAFPTELVRLCLKAGTSERGYCRECGKPWCRVVEETEETAKAQEFARNGQDWTARFEDNEHKRRGKSGDKNASGYCSEYRTIGWRPSCTCPPNEPRPALVLDPFAGSGRTGVCAQRMFLDFIGCELNPEYADMAGRILRDDCPLFSTNGEP